MIELNWTLAVGIAIFLATVILLNQLFFKPLFRVLDERRSRTSDLRDKVRRMHDEYEALIQRYDQTLQEERQSAYRTAEAVRSEALKERQRIMAEARSEGEKLIAEARRQIREELESAREKLAPDAEEIAGMITAKVLDRS